MHPPRRNTSPLPLTTNPLPANRGNSSEAQGRDRKILLTLRDLDDGGPAGGNGFRLVISSKPGEGGLDSWLTANRQVVDKDRDGLIVISGPLGLNEPTVLLHSAGPSRHLEDRPGRRGCLLVGFLHTDSAQFESHAEMICFHLKDAHDYRNAMQESG